MRTFALILSSFTLIGPSLAYAQPIAQGSFNNVTYLAVLAPSGITWSAAEASAVAMGGQLASITSAAQNQFLYSLVSAEPSLWAWEGGIPNGAGIGPWLGGYRQPSNPMGSFQWIDGAPFTYSNWAVGEPNDYGGNENYVEYYSNNRSLMNNTWNDYPNDTTGDPYHSGPNPHGFVVEIVPEVSTRNLFGLGAVVLFIGRFRRIFTGAAAS